MVNMFTIDVIGTYIIIYLILNHFHASQFETSVLIGQWQNNHVTLVKYFFLGCALMVVGIISGPVYGGAQASILTSNC
jgi:hypothetical protein